MVVSQTPALSSLAVSYQARVSSLRLLVVVGVAELVSN